MHRIRVFLAWLLLAALPLQGFAAASMLHCGPASAQAAATHSHGPATHANHGTAAGDSHDVASHHHAPGAADSGSPVTAQADTGHTCSACASCCQVVAITTLPLVPMLSSAPVAPAGPPVLSVASRILSVPDKPPRA